MESRIAFVVARHQRSSHRDNLRQGKAELVTCPRRFSDSGPTTINAEPAERRKSLDTCSACSAVSALYVVSGRPASLSTVHWSDNTVSGCQQRRRDQMRLLRFAAYVSPAPLILALAAVSHGQPPAPAPDPGHPQGTNAGIFAFTARCYTCHDAARNGAPDRYALNQHTPEEVLASITTGKMAQYAEGLSEYDKRVVAVYVGGRPLGAAGSGDAAQMSNRCPDRPAIALSSASSWNGWGYDPGNSRFQPRPRLTAADTPKLALQWAFGFPNGNSAYGQPAVVGGRVFVGADTGFVYALNASTGCVHWSFRANAGVRTAISIGPGNAAHRTLAYFGDVKGNVYAVDAQSGAGVWRE